MKTNIIVYLAFIGIALGLAARYCFAATPRYLLSIVCFACSIYMTFSLLRFVRFLRTCSSAFLQIDGDRVTGLHMDPRSFRGKPFEIALSEVEDASLQEIRLTQSTPLPALIIRTPSRSYHLVGIENMKTALDQLLPNSKQF